jgi:hypothetical protein
MFFVERIRQIAQVAASFIDSIAAIAAGNIASAANRVEQTMAGLLTLVISFLARIAGLGKVSDAVLGLIKKIRDPIDKAIDKVVAWIVAQARRLGRFLSEKAGGIIDWWRERRPFTNSAGEAHTLSFAGSGDGARMMIATTPQTIDAYLQTYPDKASPAWKTARAVYDRSKRIIFTSQSKNLAEQERRKQVRDALADISAAFAALAADGPKPSDYPATTPPTYGPYEVEYIVGVPKVGTKPPQGPDSGTPGWKAVYDAGLTRATDKWVQMHVISEKLGGLGIPANLVPAPNSINTGPFRSFEHSVKALASATSGTIKNVVWAKFTVGGAVGAARSITGQAGLYFWKGANKSPKWHKAEQYSYFSRAAIPAPPAKGANKVYSLNFASGTDLAELGIEAKLIELIKTGRRYPNLTVFVSRMETRAATAAVPDYKAKIEAITGNPKVVLNEPPPAA